MRGTSCTMDGFCLLYLLMILVMRSGDVETNPGPDRSVYIFEAYFQFFIATVMSNRDIKVLFLLLNHNTTHMYMHANFSSISNCTA